MSTPYTVLHRLDGINSLKKLNVYEMESSEKFSHGSSFLSDCWRSFKGPEEILNGKIQTLKEEKNGPKNGKTCINSIEQRQHHSHVLLDLARIVCEEQCKLSNLTHKIMKHAQQLLLCCKCQILLLSSDSKAVFSQVFEYEATIDPHHSSDKSDKNVNTEIACFVAANRLTVNIPYMTDNHLLELQTVISDQSILSVPIYSADHQRVIGVFQVINKLDGSQFTKNDEQIFEAFAIFCGIGLENTIMYEKVLHAQARQSVAIEVLAYHAVASNEQVADIQNIKIPSSMSMQLLEFSFDDLSLDDNHTVAAAIRMFIDLDLIEKFHINYKVLCRWLLSVKKNYRDVAYHNWRHAFNVAQCMFASLKTGRVSDIVSDLEAMCLLVACLCHDLDHRGTNNQFLLKTASPLSILYSTSVLEHHHFDHCIMLLNAEGNQIFSNLDQATYENAMSILEKAILATDLALYFAKREQFFNLVDGNFLQPHQISKLDWRNKNNQELLFAMLMTSCDISAITKPWHVQKKVATLVANEFFDQGDLEREKLNIRPTAMMDRSRKHEIPELQVQFIDSICLPLYQRMAKVSTELSPLLDGCLNNRENWINEAEKAKTNPDAEMGML